MATPTHAEIEKVRGSIFKLMTQEYENRTGGELDPYEFGTAVAPLVNALAALSLMEKQEHQSQHMGEASRSDD